MRKRLILGLAAVLVLLFPAAGRGDQAGGPYSEALLTPDSPNTAGRARPGSSRRSYRLANLEATAARRNHERTELARALEMLEHEAEAARSRGDLRRWVILMVRATGLRREGGERSGFPRDAEEAYSTLERLLGLSRGEIDAAVDELRALLAGAEPEEPTS